MADNDEIDTRSSFFSMVTGRHEERAADEGTATMSNDRAEFSAQDSLPTAEAQADEGSGMPHEARRVLVHLMRAGVIIAAQKPKLFELLCRYETLVRNHLAEVYLKLVLDSRTGVAFVASHDNEFAADNADESDETDGEFSALIVKRTLTLYDTLILLVLRKHYQERESAGEQKITVDIERLESFLIPFLPLTDHASLDRKRLVTRVKEMVRRKVLTTIRGTEDRYEITPIIRYVVNADFLENMLEEYKQLAVDAQPMANRQSSSDGSEVHE